MGYRIRSLKVQLFGLRFVLISNLCCHFTYSILSVWPCSLCRRLRYHRQCFTIALSGFNPSSSNQDFSNLKQIFARFRLVAAFGGNPNITTNVSIANDTGSDTQTIFSTDLNNLNYNPNTYQGRFGVVGVATPNGVMFREQIMIEIQLMSANGTLISPWFQENALVTPVQPAGTQCRLSGNAMRNHLFFATAPGNNTLFVAEKKNGIVSQLPVV